MHVYKNVQFKKKFKEERENIFNKYILMLCITYNKWGWSLVSSDKGADKKERQILLPHFSFSYYYGSNRHHF